MASISLKFGYHVTVIKFPYSNILTQFARVHDMDRENKGVRLYGKQVREWSSPPPASPGIFYSSYEFPTSENGEQIVKYSMSTIKS